MGSPPTLINASPATNLVYRIHGLTQTDIQEINQIDSRNKITLRCDAIRQRAKSIDFVKYDHVVFQDNLEILDGDLPNLVASLLKAHYFSNCSAIQDAINAVQKQEPYQSKNPSFCTIKVKRFLHHAALGLMPAKPWEDIDDATGGYIIVLRTGELIAFYIYNRNAFDDYLIRHTKFERSSTSRHGYLQLYQDGSDCYLKLNLQVRFIS